MSYQNEIVKQELNEERLKYFEDIIQDIHDYVRFDCITFIPDMHDHHRSYKLYTKIADQVTGHSINGEIHWVDKLNVVEDSNGDTVFQFGGDWWREELRIHISYEFIKGGAFDGFKKGWHVTGAEWWYNQSWEDVQKCVNKQMEQFKDKEPILRVKY